MIVADTNLVAGLLLHVPERAMAEAVLARDEEWCAPVLWRSELRNLLARLVRISVVPAERAIDVCARAQSVFAAEHVVDDAAVLWFAVRSGCTAYDCEFVALAHELRVPLVTFDRQVLAAFPGTAMHPEQFASGNFWADRVSEAMTGAYAGSTR
jgi:predicted nucleic acid-binding protein